jgi:3-hydroxymyristoyl/3-hydroxydecanoyl-(acyl carrier protein) dehydratase
MEFRTRRTVPADHPSLPGHFPDTPIVPAVVILDEIAAALSEWRSNVRIIAIPTVKFLAALKPDQPFTIVLTSNGERSDRSEIEFSCVVNDQTAVRGRLLIGSASTLKDERRIV